MAEQARQEARRQIAPVLSAASDARAARGRQVDPRPRSQTGDALPAQDADLGRPEEIGNVFSGFQKYLYQSPAGD